MMKKLLWLGLGVISIFALAAAGTPGLRHPVEFTLAATDTDPSPMSFTLAPRLAAVGTFVGSGADIIEDSVYFNTAIGWTALANNTTGRGNTASGYEALYSFTTGEYNTANGLYALTMLDIGGENTAIGFSTLRSLVNGNSNTAIGSQALFHNNGWMNTALGSAAGFDCLGGNHNIFIGGDVYGQADDANTMRIGSKYEQNWAGARVGQNRTFIAGIVETSLSSDDDPSVVGITSEGRLGTMPSGMVAVSGSILILPTNIAPPPGYNSLGSTDLLLTQPSKKVIKVTYNVYQKQ